MKEGYSVVCLKKTTHLQSHMYKQQTKSESGPCILFSTAVTWAYRKKMNVLYTCIFMQERYSKATWMCISKSMCERRDTLMQ